MSAYPPGWERPVYEQWTKPDLIAKVDALRTENAKLTAELSDYHEALKFIDDDACHASEKHCGCVAVLRAERAKLTAEVEAKSDALAWYQEQGQKWDAKMAALRQRCEAAEGLLREAREALGVINNPNCDCPKCCLIRQVDAHLASLDKEEK